MSLSITELWIMTKSSQVISKNSPKLCCTEDDEVLRLVLDVVHQLLLQVGAAGALLHHELEQVVEEGVGGDRAEVPLQTRQDHQLHVLEEEEINNVTNTYTL